jgi:hypothetical protein
MSQILRCGAKSQVQLMRSVMVKNQMSTKSLAKNMHCNGQTFKLEFLAEYSVQLNCGSIISQIQGPTS